MLEILACSMGNTSFTGDLAVIPALTRTVVSIVKIVIPIILIILGMIDLGKAVTSNDEKQMKEAQKTLIKRVIYAVLIFFVVSIVQFVFSALIGDDDNDKSTVTGCISCFISDEKDCKAE